MSFVFKDMFGKEIKAGSRILYGATHGRTAMIHAAEVLELLQPGVNGPARLSVKSWNGSRRQRNSVLNYPANVSVVDKSTFSEEVLEALKD